MARIRTIKPEFFTSSDIVSLSPLARLLYIALWCEADREGRFKWKPSDFKLRYVPADNVKIDRLCGELLERRLVVCYGDGLAFIPSFSFHQNVNPRESASRYPEPDASLTRGDASNLDVNAQGGREGKGKEGKADTSVSGSRLPDDWEPSAEDRAFAEQLGLDVNAIAASFRDYWHGVPGAKGRKVDWPATWRNWCRKTVESGPRKAPQSFAQQREQAAATVADTNGEGQWRARMRGYKPGDRWLTGIYGPPPGAPGCQVPPSVLAEWQQQVAA